MSDRVGGAKLMSVSKGNQQNFEDNGEKPPEIAQNQKGNNKAINLQSYLNFYPDFYLEKWNLTDYYPASKIHRIQLIKDIYWLMQTSTMLYTTTLKRVRSQRPNAV